MYVTIQKEMTRSSQPDSLPTPDAFSRGIFLNCVTQPLVLTHNQCFPLTLTLTLTPPSSSPRFVFFPPPFPFPLPPNHTTRPFQLLFVSDQNFCSCPSHVCPCMSHHVRSSSFRLWWPSHGFPSPSVPSALGKTSYSSPSFAGSWWCLY